MITLQSMNLAFQYEKTTSALYILIKPLLTFDHVCTPLMFHN